MKIFFKIILWICIVPTSLFAIDFFVASWDDLPSVGESFIEEVFQLKDDEKTTPEETTPEETTPEETTPEETTPEETTPETEDILLPEGEKNSTIQGNVFSYANGTTSIPNNVTVTVDLYYTPSNTLIETVIADDDGQFSFTVAKGDYTLIINATGYITITSQQSVNENEIKYTEPIILVNNTQPETGSAAGRVTNALDGRGLANITIKVRTDWNNREGDYYANFTTTTNSSGYYSIENLPTGYYTVEASFDGYVTGYTNIIVMADGAKTDYDFTISPTLSDSNIRIVLTWGASPSDLDSHLIGNTPSNDTFHIYYMSKAYNYQGTQMANLDVDDTSSYGPETITILKDVYGTYTYYVHDYSNKGSSSSTALSRSGAVVKVFSGSEQIAEYHVPTNQTGTYWTVFTIDQNGNIVPVNTVSNQP